MLTVESQIELDRTGERRLVLESARDITDETKWERRRQLLLGELRHRVSNTLAVVQSLARQTLHTTASREDFVELFEGRLQALARAHNSLIEARWERTGFVELARNQLAAYISDDPRRLRLVGDPVALPAEYATPFGLVLHELATNAAKYGALSVETGQVTLSWALEEGNASDLFKVTWRESGGPPVKAPQKKGFGGSLIERSLPGANVRREFASEGVLCIIELELPKEQDDATHD